MTSGAIAISGNNFTYIDNNGTTRTITGSLTNPTVGSAAIDRPSSQGAGSTFLTLTNPNPSGLVGIVDAVNMYFGSGGASPYNIWVGTFYLSSGTTYICRGSASLGNFPTGGLKNITGLSIRINPGDVMGWYGGNGTLDVDSTVGGTELYLTGLNMTASSSYSFNTGGSTVTISLLAAHLTADLGQFRVKGTYIHYADNSGEERRFQGTDTTNNVTAGLIRVGGTDFIYGDNNGDERGTTGT